MILSRRNFSMGCLLAVGSIGFMTASARAGDASAAAAGTSKLGWQLVRASGDGNAILSPASVWEAIAMTHAGARGETAAEIAVVLGMPDDAAAIADAANRLRFNLAAAKGDTITLTIANRIWSQQGMALEDAFTGVLESKYGAAAGLVDFATRPEDARAEINAWVGKKTVDKIPELLKSGTITTMTRLVLTNAIYMKAPWAMKFETSTTRPDTFTLAGGQTAQVPFMNRTGKLVGGKVGAGDAAATVCEIPYAGNRLAMVLIVPEKPEGLSAVLASMDGDWRANWNATERRVRQRPVVLSLPKWTARKPLSLKKTLHSLGMKRAFVMGEADLSGMDGSRDLFVSDVVHEGFVEVSEEGTEAAAATGVVVATRSAVMNPEEPLMVKADRPFAWAVVERDTGAVLFAGTVTDPR